MELSNVCGRWREVTRSASKLWSSISIHFKGWKGKFSALKKLVRLFLDRSQSQPLKLHLDFVGAYREQGSSALEPIFRALYKHAARWQFLSLDNPPFTFTFPMDDELGLPALQRLKVSDAQPGIFLSISENSPRLSTVEITDILGEDVPIDRPDQIKTLIVRDSYLELAIQYLARFPALETLHMRRVSFEDSEWDTAEHLSSNTITSFTPECCDQLSLDDTLHYLTLPHLTSLQVCGFGWTLDEWPTWKGGAVIDFLSRSSCSITSLKNLPITDVQTISLLEHIPALVSLKIEERPTRMNSEDPEEVPSPNRIITQPFLQRLTVDRSSRPFLPLLTDLTIAMRKDDHVEQGLFNAVGSR
ncbi:hypothetical protein PM082_021545 [Marasmius tenuissimus]|nr:hypothetical protein PM082_021545 [Marasmius tenuissimus]